MKASEMRTSRRAAWARIRVTPGPGKAILSGMVMLGLSACDTKPAEVTSQAFGAETQSSTISGEQLLADAPGGWRQGFVSDNPGLKMVEFIPEGENDDDWEHKITFESLAGKPLPDPIEFLNAISTDQSGTCEGFRSESLFSGYENDYPTSLQLMVCDRSTIIDKSQVTMIKAIQANDSFYVITRAQRGAPLSEGAQALTNEEIGGWALYMRAIKVCDGSRTEHPCPPQK